LGVEDHSVSDISRAFRTFVASAAKETGSWVLVTLVTGDEINARIVEQGPDDLLLDSAPAPASNPIYVPFSGVAMIRHAPWRCPK
jgi:hypothetical protein